MPKKVFPIKHLIYLVIIVSLFVGAFGGAMGSFFLQPYLQKTEWGQDFLGEDPAIVPQDVGAQNDKPASASDKVVDVVEKASPAVVSIVVTKELSEFYNFTGPLNGFPFGVPSVENGDKVIQKVGGGSGFIVSKDGLILTNKHVVLDEDADYTVVLNDGREYIAKILGRDPINDIAILKIDVKKLPVLELGDSDKIQIGQTVIAIGFSLGEYKNTVTKGVISGVDRNLTAGSSFGATTVLEEAIQTDAAINQGNSGGPLLDLSGKVIGINTAVNRAGESIGFAIPANAAKKIVESVKKYGKIVRPWLGVRYVQITKGLAEANDLPSEYGAMVVHGDTEDEVAVVADSPADKAGLQEEDIILEVEGQKLDKTSLAHELADYDPGDEVGLKILRDEEEVIVVVGLAERK